MVTNRNLHHHIFFILYIVVNICTGNEICKVENNTAICQGGLPENEEIINLVLDVKRIEKDDLVKYTNLSKLDLSNSKLEFIDPESLISNEHLEDLNLSGIQGLDVPEGIFLFSKSLIHLNLSKTALKDFERNAFEELPNLQTLDLSGTDIKDFSFLIDKNKLSLVISKISEVNIKDLCSEIKVKEITENGTTINCSNSKEETIVVTESILNQETQETNPSEETEIPIAETTKIPAIPEIKEETLTNLQVDPTEKLREENNTLPEIPENTVIPEIESTTQTELETEISTTKIDTEEDTTITTEIPENFETKRISAENSAKEETNTEKSQDMKRIEKEILDTVKTAPEPQESKGANIVLGIILVVMICGAVGFGYKYWKNRRGGYRNANTEDVEEGKELQNMVNRQNNEEQNN